MPQAHVLTSLFNWSILCTFLSLPKTFAMSAKSTKSISLSTGPKSIGSYEAKTHLPLLLRQVQAGQSFEISVRGQAVARLVPAQLPAQQRESAAARMREFMQAQREAQVGAGLDLQHMIEDGRA
jgi:prevent-host-death family protein